MGRRMRYASVTEVKRHLSRYLARLKRSREPIVVTHRGLPYALIQPVSEVELEALEWRDVRRKKLAEVWGSDEDTLYDYL